MESSRRRFGQGIFAWMMTLGVLFGTGLPVRAAPAPPPIQAKAAELIDAGSGQRLFALHAEERLPMASLTKLMTLYLTARAVGQGRVRLHEMVPVSEDAYRVQGSQIWLEPGEHMSVDQLLRAVAVGSANDAAYALAEFLGGSEEAFVAEMNAAARRLGMLNTHFVNAHGLHMPDHYTSADDMARLGRAAVRLPLVLHYTRLWEDRTIRNGHGGTLWLINHNRLLRAYPGADGLKTGYTREAGYCLIATAKRGATRLIAVILGAPSSKVRFADAAALMSWGFQSYETVPVARPRQVIGTVPVVRGTERTVAAVSPSGLSVTVERGSAPRVTVRAELPAAVAAPVTKGQRLGRLVAESGGERWDGPLVAARNVAGTTLWGRVGEYLARLIG